MKLLIVGNDILVIQALEGVCKQFGFEEIISCSHDEALEKFREINPSHLIITDYDEDRMGFNEGADTWHSISDMIVPGRTYVVLCGRNKSRYKISNYITLPFDSQELKQFLVGGIY